MIHDVVINNGKSQRISQALTHSEPGVLMTEALAGSQMVAPGRAVYIFIKLIVEVTLHTLLFQPANGAARFAARLHNFITHKVRHSSLILWINCTLRSPMHSL